MALFILHAGKVPINVTTLARFLEQASTAVQATVRKVPLQRLQAKEVLRAALSTALICQAGGGTLQEVLQLVLAVEPEVFTDVFLRDLGSATLLVLITGRHEARGTSMLVLRKLLRARRKPLPASLRKGDVVGILSERRHLLG